MLRDGSLIKYRKETDHSIFKFLHSTFCTSGQYLDKLIPQNYSLRWNGYEKWK